MQPEAETKNKQLSAEAEFPLEEGMDTVSYLSASSIHWLDYWLAIRRQMWKIGLFVLVVVSLTVIYIIRQPKLYESSAVVRVDPSAPQRLIRQGNQPSYEFNDINLIMATEVRELKSPDVVAPVILRLHMQSAAALGLRQSLSSSLDPLNGISEKVLRTVTKAIRVHRPLNTYLLQISFLSRTPEFSARVANALAGELIHHEYRGRADALLSVSSYMSGQLNKLRARMERSQIALNLFESKNNIVNPDDKFKLMNQRLSRLATELDADRARGRGLAAEANVVKEGNLDAILITNRGRALHPLMKALQAQRLKIAGLSAVYGNRDYRLRAARRHLDKIKNAVQNEQRHIISQIHDEFRVVSLKEEMTARAFARQKVALNAFNAKNVQYMLLKRQAQTEQKLYDGMLSRIQAADVSAGFHSDRLRIVSRARPVPIPVSPRVKLDLGLAFLFSVFIGASFVVGFVYFDRSVTNPNLISAQFGESVLAIIPSVRGLDALADIASADSDWIRDDSQESRKQADVASKSKLRADQSGVSPFLEAIFDLRSALMFNAAHKSFSALAVVSAMPQEGKSTISSHLALNFARNGARTLLIDSDLRRPQVHRQLCLGNRVGLSSILRGEIIGDEGIQRTQFRELDVLTAGPAVGSPAELLNHGFSRLIEEMKAKYQLIIVDSPPLLGFADCGVIGPVMDGVVMVVRAGKTPREYVQSGLNKLRQLRIAIAGIVLNDVNGHTGQYYDYYHKYYQHYYRRNHEDA